MTCTGTYTVTAADVAAGRVDNTATATGSGNGGPVTAVPASATVIATPNPHLTIRKTVAELQYSAVGDVLHYTITVTNDGTVPATDVTVSDPLLPKLACTPAQPTRLAVGDAMTCTGAHTVTTADLERGLITNVATVAGKDPKGGALGGSDTVTVKDPAVPDPEIHVVKTASTHDLPDGGGFVTFTYTVTNPGNVPLSSVHVADDRCSPVTYVGGDDGDGILAPGERWTFSCTQRLLTTTTNVATVDADYGAVVARDTDAVTVKVDAARVNHPTVTLPPTDLGKARLRRPPTACPSVSCCRGCFGLAAGALVLAERAAAGSDPTDPGDHPARPDRPDCDSPARPPPHSCARWCKATSTTTSPSRSMALRRRWSHQGGAQWRTESRTSSRLEGLCRPRRARVRQGGRLRRAAGRRRACSTSTSTTCRRTSSRMPAKGSWTSASTAPPSRRCRDSPDRS